MTQGGDPYVLHASIPTRWWLRHLDASVEADDFLHQTLLLGDIRVLAVQDIQWETNRALADDLGRNHIAGAIADALFADVAAVYQQLDARGIVRLEAREPLERESFVLAVYYDIPLTDATYAVLADRTGLPLLVAAADVAARYAPLADDRVTLRIITLSEYFSTG